MVGRRARANLWSEDRHGVLIFSTVNAVPDPGGKCRLDRFLHYATPERQREQEAERLDLPQRMDLSLARGTCATARRTGDARVTHGDTGVNNW